MPKVSEEHRKQRRNEIARAALRCFADKGFAATSMTDIIAESGLSAGAIYGHFASKEELIEVAVSDLFDNTFPPVVLPQWPTPFPTPDTLVRSLISNINNRVGDTKLLVQVWGQACTTAPLKGAVSDVGQRLRTMFFTYLIQWFEQKHSHDEAVILAEKYADVYVGLAQGYVTQSALFDQFDGERYLDAIRDIRFSA